MIKPGSLNGLFAQVESAQVAGPAIDYYTLLAGAVDGLRENGTSMRRALYASAEAALVRELRSQDPPLPESQVTREHLSFHIAIHKVETEWVLRHTLPLSRATLRGDVSPSDPPASVPELAAVTPESRIEESGPSESIIEPFETGGDPPPPSWLFAKKVEPGRPVSSIKRAIWASILVFFAGILAVTVFLKPERINFLPVRALLVLAPGDMASKSLELADWGSSLVLKTMRSLMSPVAQSAFLYEEDAINLRAIRYVGSVMWRSEGSDDRSALRFISVASINIPELKMNVTIRFRRNADKAFAAIHVIEMMFNSADPAFGGISDVLNIMLKPSEEVLGERLAGVIKHASSGFFIMALSTTKADTRRNRELMKEQCWFDIPIVYTSGRRAIIAFEINEEAFARGSE